MPALLGARRAALLGSSRWPGPTTIWAYDAVNDAAFGSRPTDTRASVQYVQDATGAWSPKAALELPVSDIGLVPETGATNWIRNPRGEGAQWDTTELCPWTGAQNYVANSEMVGANVGAGTGPTGHGALPSTQGGLTKRIVGAGTTVVDGVTVNWVDINWNGVASGNGYADHMLGPDIPIGTGEAFRYSVYVAHVAGNRSGLNISLVGYALPGFSDNAGMSIAGSLTGDLQRFNAPAKTITAPGQTGVSPRISLQQSVAGTPVDVTLRIGFPTVTRGSAVQPPAATSGTALTGLEGGIASVNGGAGKVEVVDGKLQITGDGANPATFDIQLAPTTASRTYVLGVDIGLNTGGVAVGTTQGAGNLLAAQILNPAPGQTLTASATGSATWVRLQRVSVNPVTFGNVSVQWQGIAPTNWFLSAGTTGLVRQIVGQITEGGVDYLRVRWRGISAAASSLVTGFENASFATAASGQTWTGSLSWKMPAGSLNGLSGYKVTMAENTSGGVFVAGATTAISPPSAVGQRPFATRTFSGGGTVGAAQHSVGIDVANGALVDITLDHGWPNLKQLAFLDSPVAPAAGSTGSSTRAHTGVSATLPAALAHLSLVATVNVTKPLAGATIAEFGSPSDRLLVRRSTADGTTAQALLQIGGVTVATATTPAGTLPVGARAKIVATLRGSEIAISVNGAAPVKAGFTGTFPASAALRLGSGSSQTAHNDPIERMAVVSPLTDPQMQAVSFL